jgi:outer membrane protein assembly factor BamB
LALVLAMIAAACPPASADWPTGRGNPQRTGNLDDKPGPGSPRILWSYKAMEHFVASPVVDDKYLYVSGLGAFTTGILHNLSTEKDPQQRAVWTKAAPFLKLPMVCAPAVADGLMVFGDGMHQTDGATLYCMHGPSGLPLWQYPVPGKLVHLEGSPTIHKDTVIIGGGDAGVLCVSLKRVVLDGKEYDLPAVRAIIEKRWSQLMDRYEQDKKRDPQFALPPNENALPKPAPKFLWQAGKGKWHVDSPVGVVGDRVLVASAYLDDDKVGKRALLCLNAADGSVIWEAPLTVNPWAGPTLAGDVVLVGCSSIRLDRKKIGEAKGAVVALSLADGKVLWQREVPGGVLGPIAVKGDAAVYVGTDAKVVARNLTSGERKWTYEAPNPFFAGAAIAGGVVYVVDLKAQLHALSLADGKVLWVMDVPADPAAQVRGTVFGSPIVHGGLIYLATCDVEGENPEVPCMVACIADKSQVPVRAPQPIAVDKQKRTITIPCRVAPRKLPTLNDIYPLEVAATYPSPEGQKAHETVVTFESRPSDVHKALEQIGLKPGGPPKSDETPATGPEVRISLAVPGIGGRTRLIPIERTIVDVRTGKPLPPLRWLFTGSVLRQPDPDKDVKVYGADFSGTLVALFPVTDEAVFQSNLTMKQCRMLRLETNKNVLPEEGTPLQLVIEVK